MNSIQSAPSNQISSTGSSFQKWSFVHKWSSLICTVFLLLLCITGAPLIFHEEIEVLTGEAPTLPRLSDEQDKQRASYDDIIKAAAKTAQDKVVQFVLIDIKDSRLVTVILNDSVLSPPGVGHTVVLDARTAKILTPPKPPEGFMHIMLKLHTDLYAGLPGTLFLGLMGFLFVIAVISGVVLYSPFMRKLNFAEVRSSKTRQIKWLDWHNLIGVISISWVIVVGLTGVINTLGEPIITLWQSTQMKALTEPYAHLPEVHTVGSIQKAVNLAENRLPEMTPYFVAMPGTAFSSKRHLVVFMRGNTPLTAKLFQPVLIDGETIEFAATAVMPWYVQTLLLSQPLHFGDYAGLSLKIVWLLLDMLTIFMLISGLYLWTLKRKTAK